jgi:hypothetical protein
MQDVYDGRLTGRGCFLLSRRKSECSTSWAKLKVPWRIPYRQTTHLTSIRKHRGCMWWSRRVQSTKELDQFYFAWSFWSATGRRCFRRPCNDNRWNTQSHAVKVKQGLPWSTAMTYWIILSRHLRNDQLKTWCTVLILFKSQRPLQYEGVARMWNSDVFTAVTGGVPDVLRLTC